MVNYDVLVDSDALIGLMIKTDVLHQRSQSIFRDLMGQRAVIAVSNYVVTETANMLSRRHSLDQAKQFMIQVENFLMVTITTEMHQESSKLFQEQTRSKTSFVDMSNVVVAQDLQIQKIFAFDKVYHKDFGIDNLVYPHAKTV